MTFDYSDMQDLQRDINVNIPEDLTDRQAINYLAERLTEANRTIARLATILRDFQRVIEYSMDTDYKILQVEKDLYNHTHSFHSMLLITKSKEEDNNNESNIS